LTYQLICLLQRTLGLAESRFPGLSDELGDLIEFLSQIGLNELELGLIVAEELRAGVGIERVRHGRRRLGKVDSGRMGAEAKANDSVW
jgi:hypothetical protein